MLDDFDARLLPTLHEVPFGELEGAADEGPFVREGFDLLKEATVLLTAVAGLRTALHGDGLTRDHAIVVGHYARMVKLMKCLIRQLSDGHGGDQQIAISREFMDSASTVCYLLGDPDDGARFESYVMDGLIAEREFLKDVREQVTRRGNLLIPIEERINRSIAETLTAAGVREEDIPARRKNGWPTAQARMEPLGPTAYAAYRTGSGAVHGSFTDIYKNHLIQTPAGFEIELRPLPFRPQPLLTMAMLSVMTHNDYCARFLRHPLPAALDSRGRALMELLLRVDQLHERHLADRLSDSAPSAVP